MRMVDTWISAREALPILKEITKMDIGLKGLVRFFCSGELDLYFYEDKEVYCDYDEQHEIYLEYLDNCKKVDKKPLSRMEYFNKQHSDFDILVTSYDGVNKFGHSCCFPIYHLINKISKGDEEDCWLCLSVIEAGHCFNDLDKDEQRENQFPIELYTLNPTVKHPITGCDLNLDNTFLYSEDLKNFDNQLNQTKENIVKLPSYLDKDSPYYAVELDIAIKAHQAICINKGGNLRETSRNRIFRWLEKEYPNESGALYKRIATVASPKIKK